MDQVQYRMNEYKYEEEMKYFMKYSLNFIFIYDNKNLVHCMRTMDLS